MSLLAGLHVLVTRPKPQGEILCEKIRAAGGEATYFPTIDIIPVRDAFFGVDAFSPANYDWLIFISPQAVYQSVPFMKALPANLSIAAVGAGTAKALKEAHLPVHVCPSAEWSSEGLLKAPELQQLAGKKIAIMKGDGGRELLSHELAERGALVTSIITYRRALPSTAVDKIVDLLHSQSLDVVICTSNEGMQNLKKLLAAAWADLAKVPILVISERMQARALELGFENILLAKNASHEAILETLAKEKRMTENTADMTNNSRKTSKDDAKRKRWPWATIGILFSAFAVVVMIVIFYMTNFYYLKNLSNADSAQNNAAQLQKEVGILEQQILQLTEDLKTQTQVVNGLRQTQSGYNREEWRVLEAEFLTKLANDKLQLENNLPQAIMLLQSADQEIRNLNDAKFLSIRKALASDIASLQATPQVDVAGIYMRLMAASEQLDKLPLPNKPAENQVESSTSNESLPWWKRGLRQTWQALRQIVTVRYDPNGTPPLVLPEQQEFLFLNLHAALEKAMWGLLHQQPDIYRASLDQTIHWVKQYFVQDSAITQSVLSNLAQLQAVDIHPAMPKVAASLQAFHEYFAAHGVQTETQPAASNQ